MKRKYQRVSDGAWVQLIVPRPGWNDIWYSTEEDAAVFDEFIYFDEEHRCVRL